MAPIIFLLALAGFSGVLGYPSGVKKFPPQCVDPTFACQDLKTARLCGVVKSCINDIWSTMNAPDDNDDICSICKEMVKEARDQLLSNMTQEEIKEVFEGSCKLIPIKFVADGCIKIVDEFIPELVEMLASRMDPNMVCTVSGLCNLAHLPIKTNQLNVNDDLTCQFCTHVLEHVKELVTANTTVEEFRTALQNFCNHTGSFSSKCTEFVNEYFDTIFGFIKNLDTKGFCTLAGLCGNDANLAKITPLVKLVPPVEIRKKVPMVKLVPAYPAFSKESKYHPLVKIEPLISHKLETNDIESNDIFAPSINQLPDDRFSHPSILFDRNTECALCKAITFFVKEDLKEDRSMKTIENTFDNICKKWVKEFPKECENILKKYSFHMKRQIHEGADFDDICSFVKACPITDMNKDLSVHVIHHRNSSNILCDVCKEVFDQIESLLKDPNTKQSVEKLAGQICNNLPSSLRDECNKFIDDNLDQLFNILEQELVADNVCPALRLCPSPTFTKPSLRKHLQSIECDLCKDLVQQLQAALQQADVKAELKNLVEKGCSVLPQELSAKCKELVDQNFDTLITVLVQDMDPNLLCSLANLCQNSQNNLKKPVTNEIECDFCKEIVERLDEDLKDQRTEEKIKEALHQVCSYLPKSYAVKCRNFVNTYSTLLISLLAHEMDPKVICTALKLCPDSLPPLKKKVDDIECDLCKKIVQKLDDELEDKATEDEIKEALEKVCSYFPSSMTDKCVQFVDSYSEILINLLAEELSPEEVCGALKLCAGISDSLQEWRIKAKNLECEGCQSFLHYMQNVLMDATIQEALKGSMKKVCKILPKTYEDNCEAYIEEYGSSMLVIIAQYIDPSVMCYSFDVCPGNAPIISPTKFRQAKPIKADECSICKTVVDYLDQMLEQDEIDKEITAIVEKVCTIVPSSFKETCTTIIEVYGPYLLQMLGQSLDSTQVCQTIDMCAPTPGHVHLLGGEKCTFGPSYWCQSKVHASACKAEMYCKQRVWLN